MFNYFSITSEINERYNMDYPSIHFTDNLRISHDIFKRNSNENQNIDVIYNNTIWNDLNIFSVDGVFSKINYCHTFIGYFLKSYYLVKPVQNKYRIDIIKYLIENPDIFNKIDKLLLNTSILEKQIYNNYPFKEIKSNRICFYSNSYLKKFNNYYLLILLGNIYRIIIQPIYIIFSPLLCIITPFFLLRYKLGLNINIDIYIKIIINVIPNIISQFDNRKSIWFYLTTITSIVLYINSVYNEIYNVLNLIKTQNAIKYNLTLCDKLILSVKQIYNLVKSKIKNKTHFKLPNDSTICSISDNYLVKYWDIINNHSTFLDEWILLLGEFDILLSIVKYYKICSFKNLDICFSSVNKNKKAYLYANNFYHPNLIGKKKNIVYNSIELGGTLLKRNIIITGPNACGKTMIIKSLTINLLLSNAFGIANSNIFIHSHYDHIYTHFRIKDIIGTSSLFETEVKQISNFIDNIGNKSFLIIFDELFTSTSELEGVSCAYAVAKILGNKPNGNTLITTHYHYLTKLGKSFINTYVDCQLSNKKIVFNYKLKLGISFTNIALLLLPSNLLTEQSTKILNKIKKSKFNYINKIGI